MRYFFPKLPGNLFVYLVRERIVADFIAILYTISRCRHNLMFVLQWCGSFLKNLKPYFQFPPNAFGGIKEIRPVKRNELLLLRRELPVNWRQFWGFYIHIFFHFLDDFIFETLQWMYRYPFKQNICWYWPFYVQGNCTCFCNLLESFYKFLHDACIFFHMHQTLTIAGNFRKVYLFNS